MLRTHFPNPLACAAAPHTQHEQLAEAGLTASHIAATVLSVMGRKRDAVLAS